MSQGFLRAYRRVQKLLKSTPARIDGSFVAESSDGITRLTSQCQTVTPEETARLERKRGKPIDFEDLPT